MGYATGQPVVWPCMPDWSNPVVESLAWLTDVMQASATAMQQVRMLRNAPRRGFSWQASIDGDTRRIVDAIRRQLGVGPFRLPIYPDVQMLAASVAAGATAIPCATVGYDFVVGGSVLLWRTVTMWELVTISAIAPDSLTLASGTVNAWGVGDRLYPVRKARLTQPPQETQHSDDISMLAVQALIDEPCDWTPAWPSATVYRGVPVMDWRGDEGTDPTDQYNRVSGSVDMDTGPVYYYDLPGQPFRTQSQDFFLNGRADHAKFRALLYQLAGQVAQCWVPDWQASMRLTAPIASTDSQLTVAWQGYTQFDAVQVNRRDLRIELFDGTALYRRITGSVESGANEVLQIDSAAAIAIDPSKVRQINFMSVCAQAADAVQLQHDNDDNGHNVGKITWQACANDV